MVRMPFGFLRRSSQEHDNKSTPKAGRLSIRSAIKEALPSPDQRRVSTPSTTLRKSNSLTVLATPPGRTYTMRCRFIATSTKLGSGAYGAVLQGQDVVSSTPVAIKFIPDGRMRTSSLEREVAILERLSGTSHPSLLRFHGHVRPEAVQAGEVRADGTLPLAKPHTACHALVMDMVRGGELFDYVVKCEGLKEPEAAPLFAQLCDAVLTGHGLGIAHRDLKLENVLLVKKKSGEPPSSSRIKLIDWGLAHQHAITADGAIVPELLHSRCGSRSYMAPEVTNKEISGTVGYDGFAADVWSLGVCLFAMHLAFFPFEQAHPEHDWRARRVIEAQRQGKSTMQTILSFYPQKGGAPHGGLSEGLLALLDRMLVFNPKRRASLEEVLASEWLAPHLPPHRLASLHALALGGRGSRTSTCSTASASSEGLPTLEEPSGSAAVCRSARHDAHSTRSLATAVAIAAARQGRPAPVQHIVVAGGAPPPPPQRSPKHARYGTDNEAADLAALLSKACKVSGLGSPRRPGRSMEDKHGKNAGRSFGL